MPSELYLQDFSLFYHLPIKEYNDFGPDTKRDGHGEGYSHYITSQSNLNSLQHLENFYDLEIEDGKLNLMTSASRVFLVIAARYSVLQFNAVAVSSKD
ncbi:hypothetical protein GX51_06454 [Blastomyces parvus]|uniref:Uncharacterized protein n=1 Tax=Blastomyces parvus TaxID=2060905 RepID=A0A2B7WR30_9EURO|nr:hypothetical protein GX51_06454 [Blastomyces parvus]